MVSDSFPFSHSGGTRGPGELLCAIDYSLDDRPESVVALVRSLHPLFSADAPWRLDLSRCDYVGPDAGAIIVATVLAARDSGFAPTVLLPTTPHKVAEFCYASALEHYVRGSSFPTFTGEQPVTVPMQVLAKSQFSDSDPLIGLLRHHIDLDAEVEEYLRICMNELVQNVQDHSASPIGAIFAARYMWRSKEVRIAIVDRGVGIGTTVRAKYPGIPDTLTAISRVMEGGVSAKSRPNNMGVGISNLCAIVQHQLEGRVFIVSQDAGISRQPNRRDVSISLECPFPGTAVFMNVPVDH